MKKAFSIVMALILLFPLLPHLNIEVQADDVTGIKLEQELRAIIAAGIMSGYEDGTYKPGNSVTREEFAAFLARALELPAGPSVFKDVSPSSKLAPYINAAAAVNIINGGTDGNFNPKNTITRKDMALMINNALSYLGKNPAFTVPAFSDVHNLSSAHRTAIGKSVTLGIISGFTDNTFRPDANAQRDQAAAFIYRMLEGKLPEPKPKAYQTASIDAAGNITRSAMSYESFDLAKQAMVKSSAELVTKEGKIIHMKDNAGMAFAKPASGASIVYLYTDAELKNAKTYVTASPIGSSGISTEMKYITSNDTYVQVYLGGENYYVKQEDLRLVPFEGAAGRSYYQNTGGTLIHFIYNIDTNKYVSYHAGPAPDFMQASAKYFSWDGFSFYNENGSEIGRAYQYFQFLSPRTQTSYTAAQLNSFINKALAEREATGYAKYKDATKTSKLVGLGTALKNVEAKHNVNALLLLAMAIHESDYGISRHAQENNNLFGIAVYDSKPEEGKSFATPQEGLEHLATAYFTGLAGDSRGGYLSPNTWRAYGSAVGNKSTGINVKYASDPHWGAKVAGHMYSIDKMLGQREWNKYKLGFTNAPDLNVRVSANGSLLYKYQLSKMPVTILAEGSWAQVASDKNSRLDGYIYSDYINISPIAK